MISEGRESGWLRLPTSALQPWAKFQGAQFNRIHFDPIPGKEDRGTAIIADDELQAANGESLTVMVIPQSLILSRSSVEEISKSNHQLREILEAAGPFAKVGLYCTVCSAESLRKKQKKQSKSHRSD